MRKYVVIIATVLAFYMDAVLFPLIGSGWFMPEALIALMVSFGVLMGGGGSAAIGAAVGAILDILCNKYVGVSSVFLLGAALLGGIFYNKFYADNIIIPSLVAAAVMFVKEHVMLIIVLVSGGRISSYLMTLLTHILPSALLTGGLCAAFHIILRRVIYDPRRRRDIDNR